MDRNVMLWLAQTNEPARINRRGALSLGVGVMVSASAAWAATGDGSHDFDFFFGRWTVAHRRLKDRLVGDTHWEEFPGTTEVWPLLGGHGNVDDNVLDLPAGRYRAVSIRKFDASLKRWSIWWMDERAQGIEPPVFGAFKTGVGVFLGDDSYKDHPIKVKFEWTNTNTPTPQWSQAFSADDGKTWEVNWTMVFSRAASHPSPVDGQRPGKS